MVEAHFGVPMLGAANTLNTRLIRSSVLFMPATAKPARLPVEMTEGRARRGWRLHEFYLKRISVHDLDGALATLPGATDYEAFLCRRPRHCLDYARRPTNRGDAIGG